MRDVNWRSSPTNSFNRLRTPILQLGVGIFDQLGESSRNTRGAIGYDNTEFTEDARVDPCGTGSNPRRPDAMESDELLLGLCLDRPRTNFTVPPGFAFRQASSMPSRPCDRS